MPFIAQPGQLVTSLATLNERCGENSSVQKIRTALKRFARYGLLTDEPTSRNRLITIVNWGVYQGLDEAATGPSTDDQQATNKNVKNDKTLKKSNRRKQVYDDISDKMDTETYCQNTNRWQSFRSLKQQVLQFPYYAGEICGRH